MYIFIYIYTCIYIYMFIYSSFKIQKNPPGKKKNTTSSPSPGLSFTKRSAELKISAVSGSNSRSKVCPFGEARRSGELYSTRLFIVYLLIINSELLYI